MRFVVAGGALGELIVEALVLLDGIVEFAEGIADFESADVDLEPLNPVRIVGLLLGERRDGGRELVDDGGLDEVRASARTSKIAAIDVPSTLELDLLRSTH